MIGTTCVDDKSLDPQRFAYISNDTYTADEVEAFTKVGLRRGGVGVGGRPCGAHCGCWAVACGLLPAPAASFTRSPQCHCVPCHRSPDPARRPARPRRR